MATGEKNEGLLSIPEVVEVDVEPVDRFLIIASDGIFEVMDPQTAVETVSMKTIMCYDGSLILVGTITSTR